MYYYLNYNLRYISQNSTTLVALVTYFQDIFNDILNVNGHLRNHFTQYPLIHTGQAQYGNLLGF